MIVETYSRSEKNDRANFGCVRASRDRLFGRSDRDSPWAVVGALFASMFDDHPMECLNRRGHLRWDKQGEAIIAAVNALVERHR
jgi:hypothetical protein